MFNFIIPLKKHLEPTMEISWINDDFYNLLFRMSINFVFLIVIIRLLYYPTTRRKDYLFTYFLIGTITFFLCFGLKKLDIDTGMGLGLFAIFGIIRYRTDTIQIKEMTYLFLVIGLSVINALASNTISVAEMLLMNATIIALTYGLEQVWFVKHETRKTITYDRIDLILPHKQLEMKLDLETRTGLQITRFEIEKIDFLRDVCLVQIYFLPASEKVGNLKVD